MNAPVEWRVIPSYPDYQASSTGLIVRVVVDQRGHKLTGQPLKSHANHAGYLELSLCRDGQATNVRVNRMVCEAFHGPAPSRSHHAAHINGNSVDNSEGNLAWKLPVANEADKVLHGTAQRGDQHWSRNKPECRARGEGHGRSKLNADAVRAIRSDPRGQRKIAAQYGVSQRAIQMVQRGKTWGHVV
jgi:hypothetical protein